MNQVKIIIEIKDGLLQTVYSNTPLTFILIDHDAIKQGGPAVSAPEQPDIIAADLFTLYNNDTPRGAAIRTALERIKY